MRSRPRWRAHRSHGFEPLAPEQRLEALCPDQVSQIGTPLYQNRLANWEYATSMCRSVHFADAVASFADTFHRLDPPAALDL
jgi:hypothetical protein